MQFHVSKQLPYLTQFVIVPNVFSNPAENRFSVYERGWLNFDEVNFILEYFSIDWNDALRINEENIDYSREAFLNKINTLLE